jgi:hypothetical protein
LPIAIEVELADAPPPINCANAVVGAATIPSERIAAAPVEASEPMVVQSLRQALIALCKRPNRKISHPA